MSGVKARDALEQAFWDAACASALAATIPDCNGKLDEAAVDAAIAADQALIQRRKREES